MPTEISYEREEHSCDNSFRRKTLQILSRAHNNPFIRCENVRDTPAAEAGLQKGDIITEFDGRSILSMNQLQDTLQYYAAGETVAVVIQRSNNGQYQEQTVNVTLGSAQDAPQTSN